MVTRVMRHNITNKNAKLKHEKKKFKRHVLLLSRNKIINILFDTFHILYLIFTVYELIYNRVMTKYFPSKKYFIR